MIYPPTNPPICNVHISDTRSILLQINRLNFNKQASDGENPV